MDKRTFCRVFGCGAIAAVVAGCVTTAERSLPLATVADWRITEVAVDFTADATVNIENFETQISLVKLGQQGGAVGTASMVSDPAGGGRNPEQERIAELNATPEVKAQARAVAAGKIAERFRAVFATAPAGKMAVRVRLRVSSIQNVADAAQLAAVAEFESAATGQVLMRSGTIGHVRQSRRAAAVGAFIGGGVAGLAGAVIAGAIQDRGKPEPFVDVCNVSAERLKDWLLKP